MSFLVILFIPIFGYFSDKIGRKTIISHSILVISALSIPFFQSLQSAASYSALIVSMLLAISCGAYFSVTPTIITESLPITSRCINYAIFYTIPAAIVSGTSPFLSGWLISLNPIYISCMTIILAICSIISLRSLDEPMIIYGKLHKYSYEFLKP